VLAGVLPDGRGAGVHVDHRLTIEAAGYEETGERGGQLSYRPETSQGLEYGVISLMRRVFNGSVDVLTFEKCVVRENLLEGRALGQKFENVCDAKTLTANAGAASALTCSTVIRLSRSALIYSRISGASGEGRTPKALRPLEPKSSASASSATLARPDSTIHAPNWAFTNTQVFSHAGTLTLWLRTS
jgi:hypothetical protein